MAIGPEQLDIKALAKIFLLKSQLGVTLTKEDLREILLTFTEEDFDGIRDLLNPASAEKKALREMINEATQFLNGMKIGKIVGYYPQEMYDILEEAINLASAIARTTYDGDGEEGVRGRAAMADTTAALMNIKERTFGSVICEDGAQYSRTVTNAEGLLETQTFWYGPHRYYGTGTWVPVKKLRGIDSDGLEIACYVTMDPAVELPTSLFTELDSSHPGNNRITGLFLHDEAAAQDIIITRQSSVSYQKNGSTVTKSISDLGNDFTNILIINGAIINDVLYCENEDVRYASLASSYLGRPINPAPCTFFAGNAGIRYEYGLSPMFTAITGTSGNKLTDSARNILNITPAAAGSTELESVTTTTVSRGTLTALPDTPTIETPVYVDNLHKVVTGIGKISIDDLTTKLNPANESSILYCSNGATVVPIPKYNDNMTEIIELKLQVTSADGTSVVDVYDVAFDSVLVDQQADIITKYKYGEYDEGGKPVVDKVMYISEHRPVNTNYSWIPAKLIGKYYISPEPINSDLRLYKDNPDIVQIVGIVYDSKIFSRHPIPTELTNQTGQFRLSYVNCGYYDGHVFSANPKNQTTLAPYLNHLDVIKNGGGNAGILGFVQSEFPELYVNSVNTGDYYWKGTEANLVRLPDTREELKLYLNAVAYQTVSEV